MNKTPQYQHLFSDIFIHILLKQHDPLHKNPLKQELFRVLVATITDHGSPQSPDPRSIEMFRILGHHEDSIANVADLKQSVFPFIYISPHPIDEPFLTYDESIASSAYVRVQQHLNSKQEISWGMIFDGNTIRFLRSQHTFAAPKFFDINIALHKSSTTIEETSMLISLLCHVSRWTSNRDIIETLYQQSEQFVRQQQHAIYEGAREAVKHICNEFLHHPQNTNLRKRCQNLSILSSLYHQSIGFVYRLIFLQLHGLQPKELSLRKILTYTYPKHSHYREPKSYSLLEAHSCNETTLHRVLAFISKIEVQGFAIPIQWTKLQIWDLGYLHERLLGLHPVWSPETQLFSLHSQKNNTRKATGSYYSSQTLIDEVMNQTIQPLLAKIRKQHDKTTILTSIQNLRICDPACGSGFFLVSAAHRIAKSITQIECQTEEVDPQIYHQSLQTVIAACIYGVDINPLTIDVCCLGLVLTHGDIQFCPWSTRHFRKGNAVKGLMYSRLFTHFPNIPILQHQSSARIHHQQIFDQILTEISSKNHLLAHSKIQKIHSPKQLQQFLSCTNNTISYLHWELTFPEIFNPIQSGFDAIVGNPPWVSYSGRQAEPLIASVKRMYQFNFSCFQDWLCLHSLFVERSLEILRIGGRLGLIVPSPVCTLDGYARLRQVIHTKSLPQEPMIDFGEDAFATVTQPSCAIILERANTKSNSNRALRLQKNSPIQQIVSKMLSRIDAIPKVPAATFKDIGVHTGNCAKKLIHPHNPSIPAIYEGKDIQPYRLAKPRLSIDIQYVKEKGESFNIRSWGTYQDTVILLRQTASRPIAALHQPQHYFRNSVLACFGLSSHSHEFSCCWLNSSLIAWYHQERIFEANQQSFPQIKISHLRNLPAPPPNITIENDIARLIPTIHNLHTQKQIDRHISSIFGLSENEHTLILLLIQYNHLRKQTKKWIKKSTSLQSRIRKEKAKKNLLDTQQQLSNIEQKILSFQSLHAP